MKETPDTTLDLRGTILPVAMLEFTKAFSEMDPEGVMEILMGDLETKEDLFRVLRAYPYELLDMVENETFFRIKLKRAATPKESQKEGIGMSKSQGYRGRGLRKTRSMGSVMTPV